MSSAVCIPATSNPFGTNKLALAHSNYIAWRDEKLFYPLEPNRTPAPLAAFIHHNFRAHVLNPGFSCIGGKAALSHNAYRFGLYDEMSTPEATAGLAYDLWEYVQERPAFATDYATFVASFTAPVASTEREWESLLWSQLQRLHDLDHRFHDWDTSVSSDPEDPAFSFSFAGTAFFVVGLHPASSRHARRFSWPTLVFNAHTQFERLRDQNQFERIRETVRARDYKLQGSLNPNLSNFGEQSEARQYSGRAVENNWRCPFNPRNRKAQATTGPPRPAGED